MGERDRKKTEEERRRKQRVLERDSAEKNETERRE